MAHSGAEAMQDYVYGLAAAPNFSERGICFAAHYRGLSRSEDGGRNWSNAFASLDLATPLPATSVALSPRFAHDGTMFAAVPGAILSSRDGGATWASAPLPSPPPFVSALAMSPNFAGDGTVLAATMEDGVFVTCDGGVRWDAWNIGLLDHAALCLAVSPAFARDRTLFVGTDSGIAASSNGGRFWSDTPFPADDAPVISIALSPSFEHDGTIFAGTAACGLFCSRDRGQQWQAVPLDVGGGAVNAVLLSPDPSTPHVLALLDDGLRISRDGGQTWSPWSPGEPSSAAITALVAPLGLEAGSPLLVGRADGDIQRYRISLR